MSETEVLEQADARLEGTVNTIRFWRARAAAAEVAAAELRDELAALKKLEAAHRGEEARRLERVTGLVPSADWLEMVAAMADGSDCDACPHERRDCHHQCDEIDDGARELAARIRDWRREQSREGEAQR